MNLVVKDKINPLIGAAGAIAYMVQDVGIEVTEEILFDMTPEEQIEFCIEQAAQANLIPPAGRSYLRRHLLLIQTTTRASRNYRPKPYSGPFTLLRVLESMEGESIPANSDYGWSHWISTPLAICSVPGNHQTMVKKPHVEKLAETLKRILG